MKLVQIIFAVLLTQNAFAGPPIIWNGNTSKLLPTGGLNFQGSLFLHTGGDPNYTTFLGKSAGNTSTSGTYNTGMGYESLLGLTSGVENTGFGTGTLTGVTTGGHNTAVGSDSFFTLSGGSYNVGVGEYTGYYDTGSYNTFVGYEAGTTGTTSNSNSFNTAIGSAAGYYLTSGSYNTFLGSGAGFFNTSGTANIFIGFDAGYSNTTGSNQLVIGNTAQGAYGVTTMQINSANATGPNMTTPISFGGHVYHNGGMNYHVTSVSTNYNILTTDLVIEVTDTSSVWTMTLPSASTVTGQVFLIKDQTGSAGTNNIALSGTIDGNNTYSITQNYGWVFVYSDGTNYFKLAETPSTGVAGSQIYTASGAPSSGLGADSDFYIDSATGNYYKKIAGSWVLQGSLQGPAGSGTAYDAYGDGSDGVVTCSTSNLTSGPISAGSLTRDAFFDTLTIQSGCVINTAGYKLFVKNTLDITAGNASGINNNGNAGVTATTATGAAAPSAQTAQTVGAGGTGTAGGTGSTTTGAQATAPTNQTPANGGAGGAGAAGGSGTSGAGGALRAGATVASALTIRRFALELVRGVSLLVGGAGGAGGGGGGGDGTAGAGGGSGGNGGGVLYLSARVISRGGSTVTGTISCKGGLGGTGFTPAAGNRGGAGGAGGGGGGWAFIMYDTMSGSTATTAVDCSGGSGGTGGTAHGTGNNGTGGTGGSGGRITLYSTSTQSGSESFGSAGSAGSGTTGGAGNTVQVDL